MTALAFDTHQAVKVLTAAGADEALAEAVVATVGDAVGGNVATKADLAEVKAELKGEIAVVKVEIAAVKADLAEVRAELKTDLGDLEARLHRHLWVIAAGIVGLTVSLTVALVRLTA
jgi:hypothetical protein